MPSPPLWKPSNQRAPWQKASTRSLLPLGKRIASSTSGWARWWKRIPLADGEDYGDEFADAEVPF